MKRGGQVIAAAALLAAGAAQAGDVVVSVQGLRSEEGLVRVAVCPRASFTRPSCPFRASAPAGETVVVRGVPDGVYAAQAFHDEDGDGALARRGFRPAEGLAFSNDAPMRRGPPRFAEAAFRLEGDGLLNMTMRYYQ
jgi:uncharacterized protein (DUF2141 family)